MLTQGPPPDPKCKLIISSFFALPHLLDCLIYTMNVMFSVLLLQIMGGCDRWGWVTHIRVWLGVERVGIILYFLFFFVLLYFVVLCSQSLYLGG